MNNSFCGCTATYEGEMVRSSVTMRRTSWSLVVELVSVLLLCVVTGHLSSAAQPRNSLDDELLAELDLLLPESGDNIQVIKHVK